MNETPEVQSNVIAMKSKLLHRLALVAFPCAALFLSGCVGTKYFYSPKEQMVVVQSYNNFMEIGPCGMPWNDDDQINILMPADCSRCDASQLEIYQNGKLKIDSGYVSLNRTNKTVTIELIFEGYTKGGIDRGSVPCKYNGVHKYVEREPQKGEVTRQWLKDFYRTNGTALYEP